MFIIRLFLLHLLLLGVVQAQSFSFGPISFKSLGTTPSIGSVSVEYRGFGVHYFFPHNKQVWIDNSFESTTRDALGISYAAFRRDWANVGVIAFHRSFPIEEATSVNLFFEVGWMFGPVGVFYRHISNGFGLFHEINPGVDHILLRLRL